MYVARNDDMKEKRNAPKRGQTCHKQTAQKSHEVRTRNRNYTQKEFGLAAKMNHKCGVMVQKGYVFS